MKFVLTVALFLFSIALSRAGDLAEEVFEEVNLARTQPQVYADFVAARARTWRGSEGQRAVQEAVRFLRKAEPLAPLEWSEGISRAALCHVLDAGPRGARGHYGSRGESPWKRMDRFGERIGLAGENISYGIRDARSIVISLIVDDGVRSRGHRKNIFGAGFRVAGMAVGDHARAGTMCVMDFAGGFVEAGTEGMIARQTEPARYRLRRFF